MGGLWDAGHSSAVRALRSWALLSAALPLLLLVSAAAASAAQPHRGRIYDAVAGRANPDNGTGQSFFALETSGDGKRVTLPDAEWDMPCTGGPAKGTGLGLTTARTTVALRRDGAFVASLKQVDPNSGQPVADSPVVVSGRFITAARAIGRVSFRGTGADDARCNARVRWTAGLRALNDHFVGRTSTGARVTFERTVESHPVIWNFSIGYVPAKCFSGARSVLSVADAALGRVRTGRFAATTEDANAEAVTIEGRFSTPVSASGTASETDRGGCFFTGVAWRAHRTGRGVAPMP